MPSPLYIPALLAAMMITGSSNSLWTKWQDMQCVENCSDPDPQNHVLFEQPVLQTLHLFVGETLCLIPVLYVWLRSRYQSAPIFLPPDIDDEEAVPIKPAAESKGLHGWKLLLLWFPAVCDMISTTLLRISLLYIPVSIYQMARGSLVLFVGLFSVVFLGRRLWLYQWIALLIVVVGVSLVGYSGSLIRDATREVVNLVTVGGALTEAKNEPDVTRALIGMFFILCSQVFTAAQWVAEEKIMQRWAVAPLLALGCEGVFGALTIVALTPIMGQPWITSQFPFFDLGRGWRQTFATSTVLWSSVAIALSVSMFNYFGLCVTRHVSSTARSVMETCRTLSIWLVSLWLGWERLLFPISVLQLAGFGLLVHGTFLFYDFVKAPRFLRPQPSLVIASARENTDGSEGHLSAPGLNASASLPADLGQDGRDALPFDTPSKTTDRAGE